jgi:hypothetical protein
MTHAELISTIMQSGKMDTSEVPLLLMGIFKMLERGTGVESVLEIEKFREDNDRIPFIGVVDALLRYKSGIDPAEYYTREIEGIVSEYHATAPGYLGSTYLVGGVPAVLLVSCLFPLFMYKITKYIYDKENLNTKPFILSAVLFIFYDFLIEGLYYQIDISHMLKIAGVILIFLISESLTRTLVKSD